ncbi:MAG: ATP-dependent helicase, partial [Sulfurimonas sp.]|nr:ATP-dependent helicase [Sulfurimonas sp.]
ELTNIQVMVNYELPTMEDDYFTRLRYVDEIGVSISFVTPEEEVTLQNIEIMMKMDIPQRQVKNFVPTSLSEDIKPAKDKKKKPRHRKLKQKNKKKSAQDSD